MGKTASEWTRQIARRIIIVGVYIVDHYYLRFTHSPTKEDSSLDTGLIAWLVDNS